MKKTWKRFLALSLAILVALGTLVACGKDEEVDEPVTPVVEESPEEAKVLKVLTLGHSLAVDSGHMLNLICATQGLGDYEEVVIGTMYYSGCTMSEHVTFMKEESREYDLYLSSSKTPEEPPSIISDIDLTIALSYDYWDIVVMQDGVFDIAYANNYTVGHSQAIQEFVNKNKLNTSVRFAWHMTWVAPIDNTLRDTFPYEPNSYYVNYEKFNNDRTTVYNAVVKCVSDHVVTDESFDFIIPSATAFENALSSYLEETDLHRDYVHATDLGRVITSYTWYCKLAGIDKLDELKLDVVPRQFLVGNAANANWTLTQHEKDLILESVNNALAEPLKMTQSQYTEAP